jgi:lipoyl-dependent peroxiredoxin
MKSHAAVTWTGNLREGKGQISSGSGVLQNISYSAAKRFEGEPGTNPEELIASAHAACFSMALAAEFSKKFNVKKIETSATVTLEKQGEGYQIMSSHLDTEADIEGIEADEFQRIAEEVKVKCPVSRALSITITLEARLKGPASQTKYKSQESRIT